MAEITSGQEMWRMRGKCDTSSYLPRAHVAAIFGNTRLPYVPTLTFTRDVHLAPNLMIVSSSSMLFLSPHLPRPKRYVPYPIVPRSSHALSVIEPCSSCWRSFTYAQRQPDRRAQ
ncbi:hypothetical protein M8818_001830 [Zalaria obscura]|uniref:Uncharacterized protein n=1 Tax=Zalaria obscura TaxID=2024903 RepID=A0ACC3SMN1_9PEZI